MQMRLNPTTHDFFPQVMMRLMKENHFPEKNHSFERQFGGLNYLEDPAPPAAERYDSGRWREERINPSVTSDTLVRSCIFFTTFDVVNFVFKFWSPITTKLFSIVSFLNRIFKRRRRRGPMMVIHVNGTSDWQLMVCSIENRNTLPNVTLLKQKDRKSVEPELKLETSG